MQYVARVDSAHQAVTLEDFSRLSPLSTVHQHDIWRSLQTRRWRALIDLLEAFQQRDYETWKHCERVQHYSLDLAFKLKLSARELQSLRLAALVHDIGKMAVSDAILNKQAQLSDEEYCTIRLHSEIGERLIQPLLPHQHCQREQRDHRSQEVDWVFC